VVGLTLVDECAQDSLTMCLLAGQCTNQGGAHCSLKVKQQQRSLLSSRGPEQQAPPHPTYTTVCTLVSRFGAAALAALAAALPGLALRLRAGLPAAPSASASSLSSSSSCCGGRGRWACEAG
jgi:hypothetical protein